MISSRVQNNIVIAKITNDTKLNVLNAEEVKNALTLLLRDYDKLILDLEGISFIDSTGFGTLITVFKRARENDKALKICSVSPEALELMKITKLDNVFELHDNVEKCMNSFN